VTLSEATARARCGGGLANRGGRWDAGDAGRRGVGGQRLGCGIEGDGAVRGH
jgi:hypothetical protein